jgi:hypothetical protein
MEKDMLRQLKKDGASKEEIAAHTSQTVPNRGELRMRGINITNRMGKPFGRLTKFRLTPCSLQTLIAIHQVMPDGRTRKIVVPRSRFENKEA